MDPDPAADDDTGVQRDNVNAASADGCDGGGGDGVSWARALLLHLLRRGWDLSRMAAIAGAAATAPQLLVLSVAGIALSLPFAAYLASLAATDRLMGALLPPPPPSPRTTQPYLDACDDLEQDDVLAADAPEAPRGEVPAPAVVDNNWSEAHDGGAIREEKESEGYASLPLSWEPRPSEASMLGDEDDDVVERWAEASDPAEEQEPIQQFSSVPDDSGDETEDIKRTTTKERESSNNKKMLSQGIDVSDDWNGSQVPALGNEDIVVQREVKVEISVEKYSQDSHVPPEIGDETEQHNTKEEEIPLALHEVNLSESSVPQRKIEGGETVGTVMEEVTMNTDPVVTGEVIVEQMDSVATAPPESESPQGSDLVARELQGMAEAAYVDDVLEVTLTEDIVLDIGDTNIEVVHRDGEGGVSSAVSEGIKRDVGDMDTGYVEHHGEGGVSSSSVVSSVTVDDATDLVSSRTKSTPVLVITDDTTSVASRPDVDHSNPTTACSITNKELQDKECVKKEGNQTMDNKIPTWSMEPQNIDVSKLPVLDDQKKIEDEVTVEMVLEEMTGATNDLVVGELVAGELNIIASERESLPPSDQMVADELQAVNKAAVVDEIQGSSVQAELIKGISDTSAGDVEHQSDKGICRFVSGPSEETMDGRDLISSRSKAHARAHDGTTTVEVMPNVDHHHQRTAVEYKLANERFERNVVAEDMDNYTEKQLREQLDTLKTITGYRAPPSLTLEDELAGLYIFVGVEPPVNSRDASDLNELSAKLRFLKSIIGVE